MNYILFVHFGRGCLHSLRERARKSEKAPPREDDHAAVSLPCFSRDLGHTHTHTPHDFQTTGTPHSGQGGILLL